MVETTRVPLEEEVIYPESDGEPMAETDAHRKKMTAIIEMLDDHFRDVSDVYLGVQEYFLCDPLGEYLDPPLQGYRLVGGEYERIEPAESGVLLSQELDLELRLKGRHLRFRDPATGERLLTPREAQEARRMAEERAMQAEVELERLREEIERQREE